MKMFFLRINNITFNVEIADTLFKRLIGLSFRNKIKDSEGLLFIFPKSGRYKFWMFGMRFPIDIAFISEEKKIIDKITLELGQAYMPKKRFMYALEVNKGLLKNIKIGADVEWTSMN